VPGAGHEGPDNHGVRKSEGFVERIAQAGLDFNIS